MFSKSCSKIVVGLELNLSQRLSTGLSSCLCLGTRNLPILNHQLCLQPHTQPRDLGVRGREARVRGRHHGHSPMRSRPIQGEFDSFYVEGMGDES